MGKEGQSGTNGNKRVTPCLALYARGCLRRGPSPQPHGASLPPDSVPAGSYPLPRGRLHLSPSVGCPRGPPPAEQAVPPRGSPCGEGRPAPRRQPWRDAVPSILS